MSTAVVTRTVAIAIGHRLGRRRDHGRELGLEGARRRRRGLGPRNPLAGAAGHALAVGGELLREALGEGEPAEGLLVVFLEVATGHVCFLRNRAGDCKPRSPKTQHEKLVPPFPVGGRSRVALYGRAPCREPPCRRSRPPRSRPSRTASSCASRSRTPRVRPS